MSKKMSRITSSMLLLICFSIPCIASEDYKYRVWVKNASNLKQLCQENSWMKKFYGSGLYQGLTMRLAPLLFAIGENHENAWQGMFIDFLF